MTTPWPPPPPAPAPRRQPVAGLVLSGVLMGLVLQAGSFLGIQAVTDNRGLIPVPSAPSRPQPSARATPAVQTVGPVEVTDSLERGVVLVTARAGSENVAGTGMVLSTDGYVLTNYHVVRSTQSVAVTIASSGRRYAADLLGRDATRDVALLKLRGAAGLDTVTIDAQDVTVGDVVIAAGNAKGQGYVTAHRGNVLGLDTVINVRSSSPNDPAQRLEGLIQTNAPAWPGDSGGPMFDADGEVLGMTTAGSGESEVDRQVYAVPIADAMKVVAKVQSGDESGTVVIGPKAYLGVVVQADDSQHVEVARVEASGPAAKAGLAAGDVITSVDGKPVRTRAELSTVLDGVEPDTTVSVTWTDAQGVAHTADVTVAPSKNN